MLVLICALPGAAGSDEKKKSVAVKEFLGLARFVSGRLCAANGGSVRGMGGVLLLARDYIPPEVPPKSGAFCGFFQPNPDKRKTGNPFCIGISGLSWIN